MIHGFNQIAALLRLADPVQADGIESLEDVAVFAVLRSPAVMAVKPLDVLKSGDNPFLQRSVCLNLVLLRLDTLFG
jgi:hypothetical protein